MKLLTSLTLLFLFVFSGIAMAEDNFQLEKQLHRAILGGETQAALEAIEEGARVNLSVGDTTMLNTAIYKNNVEVVKAMMGKNVNVHLADKDGRTAIQIASLYGYLPIVKILTNPDLGVSITVGETITRREKRSNVNDLDKWEDTALIHALANGHFETCQELLDKGAKINLQNSKGHTPLIICAHFGRLEQVKWLLERGADPNLSSIANRTALDFAKAGRHAKVVEYLSGLTLDERDA